jgi:hypothetical protein
MSWDLPNTAYWVPFPEGMDLQKPPKKASTGSFVRRSAIVDHRAEGVQMFKTFPDNKVGNRPYKVLFADGDSSCSIAKFTGRMTGPMVPGGMMSQLGLS